MKYQLRCLKTNKLIDDNYTLHYSDNALLRAEYLQPFELKEEETGVWRYVSWLPVSEPNEYIAGTVTYKAEELGQVMGLNNLWISFNGYWPEKEACARLVVSRIWKPYQPFSEFMTTV